MRQRTRVRKAEGDAETNRLSGIVVNEVSIVDRAANQRKFLVVKEAPPAPPSAAPATPPTPTPAPAWTIAPDLKAQLSTVLKTASEKIASLIKRLNTATEAPGAEEPQELATLLSEIGALFAKPPDTADNAPGLAPAAKAGRKLSGARLQRLNTIRTQIDELISEVDDSTADGDDNDAAVAKTTARKGEEPPAAAEPASLTEIKDALAELGTTLGKMMLVFEGQNSRIDTLAKNRGESRQVDLEKSLRKQPAEEEVVWSMDMNKPITRDAPAQRRF